MPSHWPGFGSHSTVVMVLLCTGSSCCAVSDMIVRLWAIQTMASFIVWNVSILLPIFKVGNVSPSPALFLIILPSFSCLLEFLSAPSSPSSHCFSFFSDSPYDLCISPFLCPLAHWRERRTRTEKSFKALGRQPCDHVYFNFILLSSKTQVCAEPRPCLVCYRAFVGTQW